MDVKMKKLVLAILMIILSFSLLTACTSQSGTSGQSGAKDKTFCEIVSEITNTTVLTPKDAPFYFKIGDDDSYCEIDTNPLDIGDDDLIAWDYVEQMNKKLGLPDYLFNDMMHTSYLQGKQEETFDKIKVKYYYHPDKGLNVSYYRI